jgi:MFS family permease
VTAGTSNRIFNAVVVTAALGTFVDVLDFTLFQSVRVPSLLGLGVAPADVFSVGAKIFKAQLAGIVLGGLLWGWMADRFGRRSVLFASILTYSLATLANAWVPSISAYALMRFVAGIGLAGELGAGIALVVEVMPKETRGYGTTITAAAGVAGGLAGALFASQLSWRTAYVIGGALGLCLFLLRTRTFESSLFERSKAARPAKLRSFVRDRARVVRYALLLAAGAPLFFVLLIVAPFAPEFAKGTTPPHPLVTAALATGTFSVAMTIGDVGTGLLSQAWKSRKKPMMACQIALAVLLAAFFLAPVPSDALYVGLLFAIGLSNGQFVLFLTIAAEQFGTNVRGRAAVNAPNLMRGLAIPMTIALEKLQKPLGFPKAGAMLAAGCLVVGLLALRALPETFAKDLDYDE